MTSDEYATLMDFLATRFARMDARFDAIETRLDRIEARQDAMEVRLDRIEARMDGLEARMDGLEARMGGLEARMGGLEVRQEALEARMGGLEVRHDALETRLARSEVLWESVRHDIRLVAEGVIALSERLDRFQAEINARMDDFERGLDGVHVRFDRFAVDFGTVQLDHGARLEVLERWRRGQGPGG